MCNCASCKATDYPYIGGTETPRTFADWPKGERSPSTVYGRNKIPADKAYKAHWTHCGAEAYRQRAKCDLRMHLPSCGTQNLDPHGDYKFPGLWHRTAKAIPAQTNPKKYIKAFCKLNGLVA